MVFGLGGVPRGLSEIDDAGQQWYGVRTFLVSEREKKGAIWFD